MSEDYIPGKYKKEKRRFFYQCRAHWFQKVKGRLIMFARERGEVIVGNTYTSPYDPRLVMDGRSILIMELRFAIERQGLHHFEVGELIGVKNEYVSAAADRLFLVRTGRSRE